ncbi:sarcosine oxidase subunit beta [Litchfieldella qijiaojingensis]|uniref:Sarcosine oxidase subunit beta n=1 Tax=Litchfieldella qijiaojingensis TaxID=980347 RepID=A0ABQ2YM93_9GAMM|nr:sarcosine oxidase subunit beta family protein [Halomonas qijiaojingensis]GGX87499.1 sarcosine oxidase subunit beta [Halomonas qijiaojingensis]
MTRYSVFSLVRHALRGHRHWPQALPDVSPSERYDVVIVGAGGHGLAAAYYLARKHGITNVAVIDKGWLGGGNVARNTTIVRSNYFHPARRAFTEHALKLWEGLSQELNYNVMFSQRGIINLAHSSGQIDELARRGNAMSVSGVVTELLSVEQIRERVPLLDTSPDARFPIKGGMIQHRAGTARHDAVAWGYARAAAKLGVHIIQNCEVTGIARSNGKVVGVETSRGKIGAARVALAAAGGSSRLAEMVGLRLPLENHLLQACVTEPVKPVLDSVVTHGVHNFYISQTDKGELVLGGDLDGYNNSTSVGDLPPLEAMVRTCLTLFPSLGQLRLMRSWGGVVDMSMDGSPILSKTSVDGLYINAGWCYGGFKATPAAGDVLAELIATDRTPELAKPFTLDRFASGRVVAEEGHGPRPWMYH